MPYRRQILAEAQKVTRPTAATHDLWDAVQARDSGIADIFIASAHALAAPEAQTELQRIQSVPAELAVQGVIAEAVNRRLG